MTKLKSPFLIDKRGIVWDMDMLSDKQVRELSFLFARENEIRVGRAVGVIPAMDLSKIPGAKNTQFKVELRSE